jgi:hypothetical protein
MPAWFSRARFALRPRGSAHAPRVERARQHLDRDQALQRLFAREVDGAHAAPAQQAQDAVLALERLL